MNSALNVVSKMYYLEQKEKFWEMTLYDTSTCIRSGKIGTKGRKYPNKQHATHKKAKQFALGQVNSKIIEGYTDPAERLPGPSTLLNRKSTGLTKSQSTVKKGQKPLKMSDQTPRFSRQSTLVLVDSANGLTPAVPDTNRTDDEMLKTEKYERRWRKPHKKQSTIRRMARQSSLKRSGSVKGSGSLNRSGSVKGSGSVKRSGSILSSLRRSGSLRKTLFPYTLKS